VVFVARMTLGSIYCYCNVARCVWALQDADLVEVLNGVMEPDAKRWIISLMEELPHDNFVHVLVTLWGIWYGGRQALHEHIFHSAHATHSFTMKYIRELDDYKPCSRIHPINQLTCRLIRTRRVTE
jgi:hypothetical protein